MTELLGFIVLIGVSGICILVINIHTYIINETTDRMRNLRENEKNDKYLMEIIKNKKKRRKSVIIKNGKLVYYQKMD